MELRIRRCKLTATARASSCSTPAASTTLSGSCGRSLSRPASRRTRHRTRTPRAGSARGRSWPSTTRAPPPRGAVLRPLSLGLRQDEALALRWRDVDLDARTLRVAHSLDRVPGHGLLLVEPKTKSSRRVLVLPDVVVRALRAHRARQLEERLAAGERWQDLDFVFATYEGRPLGASHVVADSFRPTVRRAGLAGRVRFHDLRHSAATLLLAQGVPQRVVMEQLGHTTLAMTARYSHVLPSLMKEAAAAMDRALGS